MKRILSLVLVSAIALIYLPAAEAAARDPLVQLLIKKGIITEEEVRAIEGEIAGQKEKDGIPADVEERVARLEEKEKALPKMIKDAKWKGDFRLRNELIVNGDQGTDENRQRIRFRYGFVTKATDQWEVGARLVTGGNSITSTNQTLENSFQHINIAFDEAYAKYSPTGWLDLTGGIMPNPLYTKDDLLWDSDVTFQGVAANLKGRIYALPFDEVFLNTGWFPLESDDTGGTRTPSFAVVQAGIETDLMDNLAFSGAATYYPFFHVDNPIQTLTGLSVSGGNRVNGAALLDEMRAVGINGTLKIKEFADFGLPLTFIGDYIVNTASDDNDSGYLVGAKLGKKIKDKGDWELYYNFRHLQPDAFHQAFPDADAAIATGTNTKAHEVIFDYGLAKNVIFGLDYYAIESLTGSSDRQILQTDIVAKF